MKKVLISSCLLGANVKYSGGNNLSENLKEILNKYDIELIPVCPEVAGGLPIPRNPVEIVLNDVITAKGKSVLKEFEKGAEDTLKKALSNKVAFAILKERSPSCGSNFIYDGTFSGKLISGQGFTTRKLMENNIKVFSENDLEEIKNILEKDFQKGK